MDTVNDKPNFDELCKEVVTNWNWYHSVHQESIKDGMVKIWDDYVLPLKQKVEQLEKTLENIVNIQYDSSKSLNNLNNAISDAREVLKNKLKTQ